MNNDKKTPALPNHWKVRISIRQVGMIHVCSLTEPILRLDTLGQPNGLDFTPIASAEHSDHLGFINWPDICAVSWRFEPAPKSEPDSVFKIKTRASYR